MIAYLELLLSKSKLLVQGQIGPLAPTSILHLKKQLQ